MIELSWCRKRRVRKAWSGRIDGTRLGLKLSIAGRRDDNLDPEELRAKYRARVQDRRYVKLYNGYGPFEDVPRDEDLDDPYDGQVFIGDNGDVYLSEYRDLVNGADLDGGPPISSKGAQEEARAQAS